ncbi:MAG: class I SAM-dependent methyltransferase [Bacteroidia bacterium]|nr:class I SAM-dependent methyltransferase [Bacteroidia bacterium]
MNPIERISGAEAVSMHDDWFEIADARHFWMIWRWKSIFRSKKLLPLAGKRLLEIGCGNGIAVDQFEGQTACVVDGCDLNEKALQLAGPSKGRKLLYNIFDLNPALLRQYDGIILLDVLEHIEDPVIFLNTAARYSKENGLVIINVPAYQWLYSDYDKAVGHLRRYSSSEMRKLMNAAGIEPVKIYYWGALLIPVAMIRKILIAGRGEDIIKAGFKPPGKIAEAFLKFLMHVESALPFTLPFGTSLIAIGKVKKQKA